MDEGRVMLSAPNFYETSLFWAGATSNSMGAWTDWSLVRTIYSRVNHELKFQPGQTAPVELNQWIFISYFADHTTNQQFGFRYYLLPSTTSGQVTYKSRTVDGTYQLNLSATICWGGKVNPYGNCHCYIQYVRLYWDYLADTQDKLINLALMSPDSKSMMLLYFA